MSLISVILPFRNAESTLAAAVSSILEQSFSDFELILINDHSTDNSVRVVKSFRDNRINFVQNTGIGVVSALNTGLKHAKGKFIARMDADDISLPVRLETQLKYLKNQPENVVLSCQVRYKNANPTAFDSRGYKYYVEWTNKLITPADHYLNRFVDAPMAHPTLFCHKNVFSQYGSYKEANHPEDFELWLRWMAQGVKFRKVESVLYEWTDDPGRLSRTHEHYAEDNFSRLKAEYLALTREVIGKNLWVIGYGTDVFRKSAFLEKFHLTITGYVDIKARPEATRKVISYDDIKKSSKDFYLVYVSDRTGKKRILDFLENKEMIMGKDFLFMS